MRIAVLFDLANAEMGGSYTFNKMIFDALNKYNPPGCLEFFRVYSKVNNIGINPDICLPSRRQHRIAFLKSIAKQIFSKSLLRNGIDLDICRAAALNLIMEKNKIDAVWAVQPLGVPLTCPYITTSWDVSHRINPYLPEFSSNREEMRKRDRVAVKVFSRAYKVLVGTNRGKYEIECLYGVTLERLLVNPFPQAAKLDSTHLPRLENTILYPANFWPHKNHLILIKALKLLLESTDLDIKLIFTGSDRGTLGTIKSLVEKMSLQNNVDFRGFVSESELNKLYSSASLVVFPTLMGPDNLPPLEALARGCRITVSDIPGAREQFERFATYFDPYDVNSVAESMKNGLEKDSEVFSQEHLKIFLAERDPQKYVNLVANQFEKLNHLTELKSLVVKD